MSETGYICPKCGNTEHFKADFVIAMYWDCDITEDGWDYFGSCGEVRFDENTNLECCGCGYEDNWHMFEEGYEVDHE